MTTWILIDEEQGIFEPAFEFADEQLKSGKSDGIGVQFRTHHGGLSDGVQTLEIQTGKLSYTVVPTRGMSLWRASVGDFEFGWKSPVRGPVHPKYVPLHEPSGLGWLDGFDELLVRCGLQSNGAPDFDEDGRLAYPLHGLIGNRPAKKLTVELDSEKSTVTVVGVVEEIRFHFAKLRLTTRITTSLGSNRIQIEDEITNLSASPVESQLLYHINFGVPLLDAGSQFVAPIAEVVPRNEHAASSIDGWQNYNAPQPGTEEQVYFLRLNSDSDDRSYALVKNAHGIHAAGIAYSVKNLPCFTVWKNETAVQDGYVTGLEPGTNYPNPRSFEGEQGRVAKIEPEASISNFVALDLMTSEAEIQKAVSMIDSIQNDQEAKVHRTPQKGWCADA